MVDELKSFDGPVGPMGVPIFNISEPVSPSNPLSIQWIEEYETYKIDENTIGVRSKTIEMNNMEFIVSNKPLSISINYEWIINQIIERNGSIPAEIVKILRDLDKEQKASEDGK